MIYSDDPCDFSLIHSDCYELLFWLLFCGCSVIFCFFFSFSVYFILYGHMKKYIFMYYKSAISITFKDFRRLFLIIGSREISNLRIKCDVKPNRTFLLDS